MKAILRSINIFSCKLKQSNNLKYNISPKIRSNKFKSISGSGNVVIEDALNKNLNDYKIHGNTVQKILPDGYTQVDYIESDGNQYINTGVNADSNLSVKMNFSSNYHIQQRHMGAIKNDNGVYTRHHITINGSSAVNYLISYSGQTNSAQNLLSTIDDNKHYLNLDIYNKKISVDEQTPIDLTLQPFDTGLNYWLFARNSNNSTNISFAIMRIYDCKMFYKGVLVRDFIPCYRNSDNEVGLYDLVNNLFYTNQRTEVFTYGSVAPTPNTPIDMVSCGDRTKNLFDKNNANNLLNNVSINNGTSVISNANGFYTLRIDCKPNTTYTISKVVSSRFIVAYSNNLTYTSGETLLGKVSNNSATKLTITTGENAKTLYVFYSHLSDETTYTLQEILDSIQIEEGSTATPYEPYYDGYKIPVNVRSENLFDINNNFERNNLQDAGITTVFNTDGTITVNGVKNNNYKYVYYRVTLSAGIYYFCGCPIGGSKNGYSSVVQITSDISSQIFDTGEGNTFILTEPTTIQFFPIRVGTSDVIFNNEVFKPMIAKIPVSYDDYQPYYNETTNIYLDEPLRKIDGYSDYIDFINGKVVRNIGNKVLDGSETYYGGGAGTGSPDYTYVYTKVFDSLAISGVCPIFSSHFATIKGNMARGTVVSIDTMCIDKSASTDRTRFLILTSRLSASTTSAFKTWLSSHNVTVDYALATPTEEDIELPNINLIEGKNIITIGTELESIIEVEYYSKEIIDISNYKYNLRKVED